MAATRKIIFWGIVFFLSSAHLSGQNLTPQEIQRQIQGQILASNPGDTIQLPAGELPLIRSIYFENSKKLTLTGQGADKTILSFDKQEEGLEAITLFNCQDISLIGFSIENPRGDAIKVQNVNGLMLKNVKTGWTKNTANSNQAHGVFIERSSRILIDECEAYAATNAGIYTRESRDIVIQGSFLHQNSVGISLVNSSNSEILDNIVKYNSVGIAVSNLPGRLVVGERSKISQNEISENNGKLLSPKTYFNQSFPEGTGIVVLAFEKVSISKNTIINNMTIGALISDFLFLKLDGGHPEPIKGTSIISQNMATYQFEQDTNYNPFFREIYIFDNTFYREAQKGSKNHYIGEILADYYQKEFPVLVVANGSTDKSKQAPAILCLNANRNISLVELNQKQPIDTAANDITKYKCDIPLSGPIFIDKN
jgi:parallel beta-helix repeat protein